MAGFIANWAHYIVSWGAAQKLQGSGIGLPDTKTIQKRERELKQLEKRFGPEYVAKLARSEDQFQQILEWQVDAGESFALGFRDMMQKQGWFETQTDRATGKTFTRVLWDKKAAPFFDQLRKESDFVEKQVGFVSKQVIKAPSWVSTLSAFDFAWSSVLQIEEDYRETLQANLRGAMDFRTAEKNAYRALAGFNTVKATQVATEFGEDYQALRRILQEHYQLFRKEVTLQQLREMAAIGRMMDLVATDVHAYVVERKREFGVDVEAAQRELATASIVFDDAVEEMSKYAARRNFMPWRTVFFQGLRQAQQSVAAMPKNLSIIATSMSSALKQAVKRGLTTPAGVSKFVEQTAQTVAQDPNVQLQIGKEFYRRLEAKVAELNREFNVGNQPEAQLSLRRKALEALLGSELVDQAVAIDRYYTKQKVAKAEALQEMALLFLQTSEGQATNFDVLDRFYNPMTRDEAFRHLMDVTKDPGYSMIFADAAKTGGLKEVAQDIRRQTQKRQQDQQRATKRLGDIVTAVSTLPSRTYSWLKAAWAWPWTKVFASLALVAGGTYWDHIIRKRLGIELVGAWGAISKLAAALRRKQVADLATNESPTTKDTARVSWLRDKLSRVWNRIKLLTTAIKSRLARWLPRLTKLLRRIASIVPKIQRYLRRRSWAKLKQRARAAKLRGERLVPSKVRPILGKVRPILGKLRGKGGALGKIGGTIEIGFGTKSYVEAMKSFFEQRQLLKNELQKEQAAVLAEPKLTKDEVWEREMYRRIFANKQRLDILEHVNYVTTFDLGQQTAAAKERRDELTQIWKVNVQDEKREEGGVTLEEASRYIKEHPPEMIMYDTAAAVVHCLQWMRTGMARARKS
jgi:uncharacterized protein YnzC (UPF0291/DUF896 family)